MKKTLIRMIALLGLICLLCGCAAQLPALPTAANAPAKTESAVTTVPQTEPAETEPAATEPATTEAPATEAPTTEPPTTAAPTTEPAPEPEALYTRSGPVFTNGILEFRYEDGSVIRRELASGEEQRLFSPEKTDDITLELVGVSSERLYFGWNEVEDWWGVNVYSVDHRGEDRREHGACWDCELRDGWMILSGFRSDVSPTELLVFNSRDEIVVVVPYDQSVWDTAVLDGSLYYIYIDVPHEDNLDLYHLTDVPYQIIRVEQSGESTVLRELRFDSFYHPAFFSEDGLVNIYSEDTGSSFSLDPREGGN